MVLALRGTTSMASNRQVSFSTRAHGEMLWRRRLQFGGFMAQHLVNSFPDNPYSNFLTSSAVALTPTNTTPSGAFAAAINIRYPPDRWILVLTI